MKSRFRRARLEAFVKTVDQIRNVPKPIKKQLPAEMQKVKDIEEKARKKHILEGIEDISKIYFQKYDAYQYFQIKLLKQKIRKEGLTRQNINDLKFLRNLIVKNSTQLISSKEVEKEFKNKINKIAPVTKIEIVPDELTEHNFMAIKIPVFGHSKYSSPEHNMKLKISTDEIMDHELQHERTFRVINRKTKSISEIKDEGSILTETLSFMRQIEEKGLINVRKRFEYEKIKPTLVMGSRFHLPGVKSALLLNKLGIKIDDVLNCLKNVEYRDIPIFESNLIKELDRIEGKLADKNISKSDINLIRQQIINRMSRELKKK